MVQHGYRKKRLRDSIVPRTIRGQLIASLVLFELVALVFFSAVLIREDNIESQQRTVRRLEYQASELAVVSGIALKENNREMLQTIVASMLSFPSISGVKITTLDGRAIATSDRYPFAFPALSAWELARAIEFLHLKNHGQVLQLKRGMHEAMAVVNIGGQPAALIWVYPTEVDRTQQMEDMLRVSALGAVAVILACTLLAALIARSLTRPLSRLIAATGRIITDPEDTSGFPLPVTSSNEASALTLACNMMVKSIEEQRAGLNDTLALLDSMLAHAPIGMAFFDLEGRIVRANQFMAQITGLRPEQFLGCQLDDIFATEHSAAFEEALRRVFSQAQPTQDLELAGELRPAGETKQTWLVNVYPVRSAGQAVRWAGAVIVNITERLAAEQLLRRTEKLAAAGRLAASIAHEINNPLEAVTNLLYLLRQHSSLDAEATEYAEAAQHEIARVAQITQQMLRFHRQSTHQVVVELPELINSVLTLYQGRVTTLHVEVERRYRGACPLFCFSGEIRQLFANLIGNALDAMVPGPGGRHSGRLTICIRPSRSWVDEATIEGVRVSIADTGEGMSPAVRQRIFEPFFTTKDATGTGLGLWVSAEIIAKHEALLRIRSRDGNTGGASGSVFMLFFPSVPTGRVADAKSTTADHGAALML